MIDDDDIRVQEGYNKLDAYWQQIGPTDKDFLTYIINPQFQGSPAWPNTRQAYRIVRPEKSLIIASDGLSDPFVGTDNDASQGFGCEVYIEAPELSGADFETIRQSWAFGLIESFAQNVAHHGGLSALLSQYGVLSTELPVEGALPDHWLSPNKTAGCLMNIQANGRSSVIEDMPFGKVDIISLTLITPEELASISEGGASARNELAERLGSGTMGHASLLKRLELS